MNTKLDHTIRCCLLELIGKMMINIVAVGITCMNTFTREMSNKILSVQGPNDKVVLSAGFNGKVFCR